MQVTVGTMSEREELLKTIETFIEQHEMPETVFGLRTMNDPALVAKLRKGRTVRIDTAAKLTAFMRDYRPTTDGKPRPRQSAANAAA